MAATTCLKDDDCDGGEVPKFCSLISGTCVPSEKRGDVCFSFDICGEEGDSSAIPCQMGRCRVPGAPTLGLEDNANVSGLYCRSNRDCEMDEFCDVSSGGVCRIFDPSDAAGMNACPTIDQLKEVELQRQNTTEITNVYYNLQGACADNEMCDFAEAKCRQRCRLPEKPYSAALIGACRPEEICDPQCPAGQLCTSFEKIYSYSSLDVDPFLSLDRDWKRASNPEEATFKIGMCIDATRIRRGGLNADGEDNPKRLKMKVSPPTTTPTPTPPPEPTTPEPTPQPGTETPAAALPDSPADGNDVSESSNGDAAEGGAANEETNNTNLLYISAGAGLGAILILTLFIYLIMWSRKRASKKSAEQSSAYNGGHIIPPSSPVYSSAPAASGGGSGGKDKKGNAGLFGNADDEAVPAYVPPPGGSTYMPDYKKPL